MSNPIFAKKVIILHKNGYRQDYTHVVEFKVYNPTPRMNSDIEPYLVIKGECVDSFDMSYNVMDRIPIKDIHMTIIDWYIPEE